jgi:hypothetical protein
VQPSQFQLVLVAHQQTTTLIQQVAITVKVQALVLLHQVVAYRQQIAQQELVVQAETQILAARELMRVVVPLKAVAVQALALMLPVEMVERVLHQTFLEQEFNTVAAELRWALPRFRSMELQLVVEEFLPPTTRM